MLGGGFLKQGADTAKYNRALLGKESHKPFARKESRILEKAEFTSDKKMSSQLRYQIQKENEANNQAEIQKKIIISVVVVILMLCTLFFVM
jgi:hypothetical protein